MYLWGKNSPANLGFFRPNQAMNRVYGGYQTTPALSGLGDDVSVDPKILLGGIGLLAAGMFLFGAKKGPMLRERKRARLRRKLAALGG